MAELKNDFRDWLVKRGLSEKTASGRQGTVYEYVRRIDKICNLIFKGHNLQSWQQLAENIYPILGLHLLCRKGNIFIIQNNISPIKPFLTNFLSVLRPYQDNFVNFFTIELILEDGLRIDNYTLIKDLLPYFTTETISIKSSSSQVKNNKNRNALEKFYQFLSETEYVNPNSGYYKKLTEKKDIKDFYKLLTKSVSDISSYEHTIDKNLELMSKIIGGTGVIPPQIDNSQDTEAYPETVCDILRISERTRKRLEIQGALVPLSNGNYSVEVVNKYIRDRFVKSKYQLTNTPYTQWWNVGEAHKETGIHKKRLQRLRSIKPNENEVSYVRVTERIYIYYPPDIKRKS